MSSFALCNRSVVQTCVMDIVPVPGAGDSGPPSSSSARAGDRELMDVNGEHNSRLADMPEFMVNSANTALHYCLFTTSINVVIERVSSERLFN